MLSGKKIILAVTGSIAAYKSAVLVRLLVKSGAEVKVILTSSAAEFITPLTLSTLSKNPVYTSFIKDENAGTWHNHVELGLWADVMLIAPASANTIAKMANGICDNMLLATYLSARCPVIVAPAMDLDMYAHPSTQNNISKLKSFGNQVLDAEYGELASGLNGQGRMPEPEAIVDALKNHFEKKNLLKDKTVLITAGPTQEAIDPVRFIGNHSTGKMGFALAEAATSMGAEVVLISGPVSIEVPPNLKKYIKVTSADEMLKACKDHFTSTDICIMSAAVADYSPVNVADQKMKKKTDALSLELQPTIDILKFMGTEKKKGQLLAGFALETENGMEHAKEKLERKNLDLVVLNTLKDAGAGFGHDTNKITIIDRNNKITSFELKSKREVAYDIIEHIISLQNG